MRATDRQRHRLDQTVPASRTGQQRDRCRCCPLKSTGIASPPAESGVAQCLRAKRPFRSIGENASFTPYSGRFSMGRQSSEMGAINSFTLLMKRIRARTAPRRQDLTCRQHRPLKENVHAGKTSTPGGVESPRSPDRSGCEVVSARKDLARPRRSHSRASGRKWPMAAVNHTARNSFPESNRGN